MGGGGEGGLGYVATRFPLITVVHEIYLLRNAIHYFLQAEIKGPRQPWHDLHCKVEGPAAYDILANFEQRWRKATKWWEFGRRWKKESHYNEDALIKLERISWILSPSPTVPNNDPSLWVSKEDDPENWHVQVGRFYSSLVNNVLFKVYDVHALTSSRILLFSGFPVN